MSYIKFDKNQIVNLEFSLGREIIRTNRAGSYSSTNIVGCNTRKSSDYKSLAIWSSADGIRKQLQYSSGAISLVTGVDQHLDDLLKQ